MCDLGPLYGLVYLAISSLLPSNVVKCCFHIFVKVENYTSKMQRRDVGNNVIEIRHSGGLDRWLVAKKTLDASHISIQVYCSKIKRSLKVVNHAYHNYMQEAGFFFGGGAVSCIQHVIFIWFSKGAKPLKAYKRILQKKIYSCCAPPHQTPSRPFPQAIYE